MSIFVNLVEYKHEVLVCLLLLDVGLDGLAAGAHGVPGVQYLDHNVAAVYHLDR